MYQAISKASGQDPVAGPGSHASSPAAWFIKHVRLCALEVIMVEKDAQEIQASVCRRFTTYYPGFWSKTM